MNLKTSTDVLTELQQSQTDAIKVYVDQANVNRPGNPGDYTL